MKVDCQKRQYVQHNYKHKYGLFWDKQLGIKNPKCSQPCPNILQCGIVRYRGIGGAYKLLDTALLICNGNFSALL